MNFKLPASLLRRIESAARMKKDEVVGSYKVLGPDRLLVCCTLVVRGRAAVVVINIDIVGIGCLIDLRHLDPDGRGVGRVIPGFDLVLQLGTSDGVGEANVCAWSLEI